MFFSSPAFCCRNSVISRSNFLFSLSKLSLSSKAWDSFFSSCSLILLSFVRPMVSEKFSTLLSISSSLCLLTVRSFSNSFILAWVSSYPGISWLMSSSSKLSKNNCSNSSYRIGLAVQVFNRLEASQTRYLPPFGGLPLFIKCMG